MDKTVFLDESIDTAGLLAKMSKLEELGQGVIQGKRALIELDEKRQRCREALRQLRTKPVDQKGKTWLCLGNTIFLAVKKEKAVSYIENDMKLIEETVEKTRGELRKRVDELRKMENSKDLQALGFNLQPII